MRTMNRLGRWVTLGVWLLGGVWGVQGQGNLATSLDMNGNFLRIVGTQAAPFPGEAVQEGVVGQHTVLAYEHEMVVPTDAAGQPTGKLQHRTFRVVKLLNASTPRITQAMAANELLKEVTMTMTMFDPQGGKPKLLMTYQLMNARIVQVRSWTPNNRDQAARGYVPAEEIAFTYTKLTITHHPTGAVTVIDRTSGN